MPAEGARLLPLLDLIVAAAERALADARVKVRAQTALDVRKVHDAGARLKRLLGEAAEARVMSGPGRHEVNNALNHLLGYGELLLEEPDAAPLADTLRTIVDGARSVRALLYPDPGSTDAVPTPGESPPAAGSVLVVDDDPINRDLLARHLTARGYRVLSMEHGQWAIEILETERVDLILLDLDMPKMDGYQTLEHLKADPRLATIPVVVVSAADTADAVIRCVRLGAEDFLTKPLDSGILSARVAASVARKRARDRARAYVRELERLAGRATPS